MNSSEFSARHKVYFPELLKSKSIILEFNGEMKSLMLWALLSSPSKTKMRVLLESRRVSNWFFGSKHDFKIFALPWAIESSWKSVETLRRFSMTRILWKSSYRKSLREVFIHNCSVCYKTFSTFKDYAHGIDWSVYYNINFVYYSPSLSCSLFVR